MFNITDWYGKTHRMTATALYTRIMQDSKSNYNWLTSAPELVRVCSLPTFPKPYAQEIKIAILKCFAEIELTTRSISSSDREAVYSCYNSLPNQNEKVIEAKNLYLTNVIKRITMYHFDALSKLSIPSGSTFNKICEEWIKEIFEKYRHENKVDFQRLLPFLHKVFEKRIEQAKANGEFNEDLKQQQEDMAKIAKLISSCGNI